MKSKRQLTLPRANCGALQVVTGVCSRYSVFGKIRAQALLVQVLSHLTGACIFTCIEVLVGLMRILSRANDFSRNRFATAFKMSAATREFHLNVADDMIRATDCYFGASLHFAEQMIVGTNLSPQART